jgi:hypothetical protein
MKRHLKAPTERLNEGWLVRRQLTLVRSTLSLREASGRLVERELDGFGLVAAMLLHQGLHVLHGGTTQSQRESLAALCDQSLFTGRVSAGLFLRAVDAGGHGEICLVQVAGRKSAAGVYESGQQGSL